MRRLIIPVILFMLAACNNNNSDKTVSDSTVSKKAIDTVNANRTDTIYGYIKSIKQIHDSVYLDVDSLFFYNKPDVVDVAKRMGRADTAKDKNGKITDIFVANDYFIINDDTSDIRLVLKKDAAFRLLESNGQPAQPEDNNLKFLQNNFVNQLFMLAVKDKSVSAVEAIFLP